jgi:cell division protein FtsZ
MAISNPLLEDISISGARGILINITASSSTLSMEEVEQSSSLIHDEAHEDANIILGTVFDDDIDKEIRVTIIATGIGPDARSFENHTVTPIESIKKKSKTVKLDRDQTTHIQKDHILGSGQKKKPLKQVSNFEGLDKLDDSELDIPAFIRQKAD